MIFLDNKIHIFTSKGLFRAGQLENNMILKNYKNKIQRINSIQRSKTEGYNITFENGESFFISKNNKVLTIDGVKSVSEALIGKYIAFSCNNYFSPAPNKSIEWYDQLRTNSTPIRVPGRIDLLFSYWFGLYSAKGFCNEKGQVVFDVTGRRDFFEIIKIISKEVFDVTPELNKHKDGREFAIIYSKNVTKFLKEQTGNNKFKKIPRIIQEASVEEQLAYIGGLSYKAYQDKDVIVFSSSSFLFIDYLSAILKNLGFIIRKKITKSGNQKKVYYLRVLGKTRDIIFPEIVIINSKISFSNLKNRYFVKLPQLKDVSIPSSNVKYESFKKIKNKENQEVINNDIIRYWGIDYDSDEYYLRVTSIKEIEKDCSGITVSSDEGIVAENLILFE